MAKKTFVVKKRNLHLSVGGKLTQLEVGSEVTVDEKHKFVVNKSLVDEGKRKKVTVDDKSK